MLVRLSLANNGNFLHTYFVVIIVIIKNHCIRRDLNGEFWLHEKCHLFCV